MRKEMALLAAHAAWHMGDWGEMSLYVDAVDAGPGGSFALGLGSMMGSVGAGLAAMGSMGIGNSGTTPSGGGGGATGTGGGSAGPGAAAAGALAAAVAAAGGGAARARPMLLLPAGPGGTGAGGAGAGAGAGGASNATGAFLRAVLCIKHDQHELAHFNIERARGAQLH